MTLLLSIETSTPICSIALHKAGKLIADKEVTGDKTHSTELTLMIGELLKECSFTYGDLSAIAISSGPGSYTGLRIGTSTAKGLCFALDIPLISVSTLEALAYSVEYINDDYLICPMLDARRMEVYCMILSKNYQIIQNVEAKVIEENSFEKELETQKIVFVGDAVEKCQSVIQHENAIFKNELLPSAKTIGIIAFQKYQKQEFENVAYFEPFYLKGPNITKSKKKLL